MKKIRTAVLTGLVLFSLSSQGQEKNSYNTAIGVKFYPTGVTLKHFVKKESQALDFIGYFWQKGTRITGLYEFHFDLGNSGNFKWYVGPGAHVGFYSDKYFGGGTTIGIDGVLGLDYKFKKAPINLSLDWQPSIEFGDFEGFSAGWGGLAVRYTIW